MTSTVENVNQHTTVWLKGDLPVERENDNWVRDAREFFADRVDVFDSRREEGGVREVTVSGQVVGASGQPLQGRTDARYSQRHSSRRQGLDDLPEWAKGLVDEHAGPFVASPPFTPAPDVLLVDRPEPQA